MHDPLQIAARRPREAGLPERLGEWRLVHLRAIDRLDEERAHAVGPDLVREGTGDRSARRVAVRLVRHEGEELLLAAPEPTREPAVDEDRYGAGGPHGLAAFGPFGPRERGTVWIRRIGRGEDHRLRVSRAFAHRTEAVHRAGERELRGSATGHEVAAADPSRVLHRFQDPVRRREPAAEPFGTYRLAREHAMALEQLADLRRRPFRRSGEDVARGRRQRPTSGDIVAEVARRGAPPGTPYWSDQRADRVERVVRDLAGPHEIPQGVAELGGESAPRGRQQLWEERRPSRAKHLAQAVVDWAVRTRL